MRRFYFSSTSSSCFYLVALLLLLNLPTFAQSTPAPGTYDFNAYLDGNIQAFSDEGEAVWNNPDYGLTFIARGTTGASLRISTVQYLNSIWLTFDRTAPEVEVREIIIKSTGVTPDVAGGNFKLNSLVFAVLSSAANTSIVFKAYKDGVYLGEIPTTASTSSETIFQPSGNPFFYNIDELRITGFPATGLRLDDINIAAIANYPPYIISNGGNNAASISVPENTVAVTTVTADDPQSDMIQYSISGGADSSKFHIDEDTGVLTFKTAPDFETPTDTDTDNIYVVIVKATDNGLPDNLFDTQTINVTVTDVMQGVQSITRADPNPTTATVVNYIVTFEGEAVTGVSAGNFAFTTTGSLAPTDVNIAAITPTGDSLVVSLNIGTVTSVSTLRLDLVNSDGVTPVLLNVPYTSGEVYTINPVVLPVELLTFKAISQNSQVVLQWATASELQNKGFEVQRSADGVKFTVLAFVDGVGTSSVLTNYSSTDRSPLAGTAYYRLKQIDFSGHFVYSRIISVNHLPAVTVQIAPNPVQDKTTVRLQLSAAQTCLVRLADAAGRTVYTQQYKVQATDQFTLDLTQYSTGIYFLTIQGSNQLIYQGKLLKN